MASDVGFGCMMRCTQANMYMYLGELLLPADRLDAFGQGSIII